MRMLGQVTTSYTFGFHLETGFLRRPLPEHVSVRRDSALVPVAQCNVFHDGAKTEMRRNFTLDRVNGTRAMAEVRHAGPALSMVSRQEFSVWVSQGW